MSAPSPVHGTPDRWWIVALVRAGIALVVGAVITFTANHSAVTGLIAFGAFAVANGLTLSLGSFTATDRVVRRVFLAIGVLGVVAGVIALVVHTAGLGALLYLVSVWAALTGFAELYCGLRARRVGHPAARDLLLVGGLTAVLALVFLFIPADPVLAVGLFGAYAIIIGVYLAIGAFTLKWALAATPEVTENQA